MTLSRLEQSRRAIRAAAVAVASCDKLEEGTIRDRGHRPAEVVAAVAEEIGWDFSEEEERVALDAYREARQ